MSLIVVQQNRGFRGAANLIVVQQNRDLDSGAILFTQ